MAKKKIPTQKDDVLAYIVEHGSITQRDAIHIGCFRLAARIKDLRDNGINITTDRETVIKSNGKKTKIARYRLADEVG